jgi:hypothetical protein
MTNQHSITPPPELVQQWLGTYFGTTVTGEVSGVELSLATQAAQWGADQELEACTKWIENCGYHPCVPKDLFAARRPKPPSLNSIALQMLGTIERDAHYIPEITDTIRQALEALND